MSLKNVLKSIGKFITKLLPWAKITTQQGLDIANEIKGIADNPTWDVMTAFTSTKLDDSALATFRQFMVNLVYDLNLASQVVGVGSAMKEASANIKAMETKEAKAGTINTIAAAANVKLAELQGKIMPIETALSIQQPAYFNPELLA